MIIIRQSSLFLYYSIVLYLPGFGVLLIGAIGEG